MIGHPETTEAAPKGCDSSGTDSDESVAVNAGGFEGAVAKIELSEKSKCIVLDLLWDLSGQKCSPGMNIFLLKFKVHITSTRGDEAFWHVSRGTPLSDWLS